MTEVRKAGMSFGVDEVELLGAFSEERPAAVNPNKGKTKYPFDLLEVGHAMRVKRDVSTVKGAVRRWVRLHRGQKFSVWRKGGAVIVKRTK